MPIIFMFMYWQIKARAEFLKNKNSKIFIFMVSNAYIGALGLFREWSDKMKI